jgi:16S rRNA (guanine966-N2)-methyltransferase
MRVIAGTAKGRRLQAPASRATRPLTDRMREAIFSSLGDQVEDALVLDLFAGSGAFGIEALSRGARRAVFVEKARSALVALRGNLAASGFEARVVDADVANFLRGSPPEAPFDLIMLDPPFELAAARVEELAGMIDRHAGPGASLLVHRFHQDPDPQPPASWRLVSTRRYGDGKLCRYQKEPI